jgi:flagellar biosynthesis protein FlhB
VSDQPDRSEKQFDPSPRRLQKAREEGNVARSKELAAVAGLAVGTSVMALGFGPAFGVLKGMLARQFLAAPSTHLEPETLRPLLAELGWQVGMIMVPLLGLLAVTAVGVSVAQTGWHPTSKPIKPKGNRISPLQGLKRLFSAKGLFDTGKALGKVALVAPIAYVTMKLRLPELLGLPQLAPQAAFATAAGWLLAMTFQLLAALLLLAVADFAFERWKWKRDLKMTMKEVKDEAKDSDGDPHVRAKRRQIARENARRPRLDHAILQADVVVTNPTHYAVVLRYRPEEGGAPRVLAKGLRERALRIKGLAAEHGVPTIEDRPLARALHAAVPEGHEIPEDLYAAVAAVLAEVYRQRRTRS